MRKKRIEMKMQMDKGWRRDIKRVKKVKKKGKKYKCKWMKDAEIKRG